MNDTVEYIETLSGFMEYIEKLPEGFVLSRGQNRDLPLLPSGLRKDDNGNRRFSRQSVKFFLDEFKVSSHHYMSYPWDIKDDYEWMIYAQHYGVPTRLLDFTYSHIISLMFAVDKAFNTLGETNDAVIWFLDPKMLNHKFSNRSEILNMSNGESLNLDQYEGPVAIQGRKLNDRINAQNGVFVYFQDSEKDLGSLVNGDEKILRKLVIKGDYTKKILSSLYSMGIGYTQIYPELDSVAKDIVMKKNILDYLKGGE
ncbi:hypothetical protein COK36_19025 [Bacillus cereus]|uniref:FRG domain-containing protein n=1 Tax=Bacillus cereus TaxID=1396 RepID=UPI000BFAA57A|nr:FRG domain-containing protein [Bacillus cereus]PFL19671.1 hypothetical protein COJ22_23455 [Bacillus cereus]PFR59661.1 hypothetical protein COK36_19025 [Bacillus cereus]PGW92003.1 hypothetical protein COE19_18130 [Bacillus cereus]PGY90705.1 hypothetical protein COE38_18530 [Bacillus cereus]PGZ22884.1 hypothetical protein COE54_31480 [Bacillus cereus]